MRIRLKVTSRGIILRYVMGIPTSKTPTVVLFDKDGQFHSFGYEAQIHYADLVEDEENCGWKYFSDLSLLRYRNQKYTLTDDQNHSMAALDVYSAILKYLKGHLLSNLADRLADLNETDVHWVLPVSASWSLSERKLLADAAENACLSHESLTFVLKPEAAAIYCKEFLSSNEPEFRKTKSSTYFSPGAQFIVLDAGGQTVEVTTHEVQSDGTMMEILYSDVLSPMDGSWGGCLVDSKVNAFLEGLFGTDVMEEFRRIKIDVLELQHSTEMMKRQCKDPENEKEDFKIWLKVPATLLDIFKNANGYAFYKSVAESSYAMSVHVKRKKMYLSNDFVIEMYRESKEKLVRHLREIFRDNPELKNVKTIIMTGGLANSEILRNEVRLSFPGKHVVVPDQADLAVVKGAVMCGFNTKMYLKV
ncbi:heat shock 70 kDa protein 12A-like isoform X3 [Mercenaria mercenaria]|uniref:heat shock 70 kDa protein 12A-like isoform X3 n=1 Tax=Mercenaria mercenaria TaxID=6596 RepID=UPI00234F77FB|nr:heat shock 70 kDa protein 12A-like isoform X3 [Mercenaria mercenaria]